MTLTVVSLFAGIGGIDRAFESAGARVAAAVEIDQAARGVINDRMPDTTLFKDVCEVTPDDLIRAGFDPANGVLTGGWPCFVAGTRILTERGWLPIEDVRVGDQVLTHKGRWRPVTSVMSKVADHTITVSGQGMPRILTTEEHPFYARPQRREWVSKPRRGWRRSFGDPEWVDAAKMAGQFASQVLPPVEDNEHDADLWWLVGRYLADGWTTSGSRGRNRVYVCCADDEADELAERIGRVVHATRAQASTCTRFAITRSWFVDLVSPLGRGAAGKTLTRRELALPREKAEALLDGWLTGDGWRKESTRVWAATTVSRSLALSMALLAQRARGVVASLHETHVPARTVIAGREVGQRTQYQVVIPDRNRSAFVEGEYGWKLVRRVERTDGSVLVHNLSVAEDESYVADGAVVHNCQDLSVAGRRLGLGGARSGLFFEIVRLAAGLRPRWLCLENVPGLLSAVCPCPGGGYCEGRRTRDEWGKWTYEPCDTAHPVRGGACGYRPGAGGRCMELHGGAMGAVLGSLAELGYGVAYRVLDAQHFGVPQRRRRVVIVGCLGDWAAPAQVLLEPEGRGGDPAPGRAAGTGASVVTALRAGSGGGCGPDDNDAQGGRLIAGTLGSRVGGSRTTDLDGHGAYVPVSIAPALTARYGKGTDSDATDGLVPVAFDAAQITSAENRVNPQPGDPSMPLAATGSPHIAFALRADPGGTGQGHNTTYVPFGGDGITHALTAEGHDASEDGTGRGTPLVPVEAIAFDWQTDGSDRARPNISQARTSSLQTEKRDAVATATAVRRLTPTECERLQGFPDGWTATSWGKPQADSPRYRQLGNSVAVPVFAWVARRLVRAHSRIDLGRSA